MSATHDRGVSRRTAGAGVLVGALLLAPGAGCGTGHAAGAVTARSAAAETDPTLVAAREWLTVLGTRDAERLLEISQLPFSFAAPRRPNRCDAIIGDSTRLKRLIACLETETLRADLGRVDELALEPTDRTQLRRSFVEALGPPRPGEHLVRARIDRERRHLEVVLLVVPSEIGARPLVAALTFSDNMDVE